jgi:drug/metabolite transporter (DMT)-like permease
MRVRDRRVGGAYLGLGLVSLIWGANFLVLKEALLHLSPLVFAPLRFLVGALALGAVLRLVEPRSATPGRPPAGLGWGSLLGLALLGITLSSLFFTISLSLTSASHAAVLNATSPLFGLLGTYLTQRERPGRGTVAGLLLSFAGVVMVVLTRGGTAAGGRTAEVWGDLSMLASAVCWSFYAVRLRPLVARHSPLLVSAYATGLGALLLVPLGIPGAITTSWAHLPWTTWLAVAYSGVLVTGGANVLWVHAIRVVGVGSTMVYQYLPTVVAVALAAWLLAEPLFPSELLGAALVLVGVGLTTRAAWRPAGPIPRR